MCKATKLLVTSVHHIKKIKWHADENYLAVINKTTNNPPADLMNLEVSSGSSIMDKTLCIKKTIDLCEPFRIYYY
ncbi:MAG TPA: hypothetical protein VHH33_01135 [Nitrososphaeraceae archaeon]|nr:hypothetical protein [Nitrososphaeraceae archaeon]